MQNHVHWLLLLLPLLAACAGAAAPGVEVAGQSVTAAEIEQGEVLYQANCASCHGTSGEGQPEWQRPTDAGTMPAPPHDSSGHTWHHADAQLLAIIAQGGQGETSAMPAFADKLSPAEMRSVLAYIKTFWPADIQQAQTEMSRP